MILLFCSSRMTVSKAATAFLDLLTEIAMLPNNILGVFIKSIRKSIEIACEKFLFNVCRHQVVTKNLQEILAIWRTSELVETFK